jgi:phosphoribosyl-ATP pyrophosphohydrolase/phosphoribosyl-AMP cyclohydrolase
MVAFANREALERTAATGKAHYFSRSRGALWRKGESSGNEQVIREIRIDCDGDTVLYRVEQTGPACHTALGPDSRPRTDEDPGGHLLTRLATTIARRAVERPAGSYTVQLLDLGVPQVSQKVGEEAVEMVVAANAEGPERLASEAADLLYHLLVLLQARGVPLDAVLRELEQRGKVR